MLRPNPRGLPYTGPTLRANGPNLKHTNPTWTIPSTAQVGDYLVIMGNNGNQITNDNQAGGYGWHSFYGPYGQSSYVEQAWIKLKVATAEDVGTSYTLNSSGYPFMAQAYIFTNPNMTNLDYKAPFVYWYYKSVGYGSPANTSARSQQTFPAQPNPLGPNCLRLFVAGMNGNSTWVSSSWSGGLTTRAVNDSYWWRGSTSGWIAGSTGLETPTVYFNQGGALAWMEMYLP